MQDQDMSVPVAHEGEVTHAEQRPGKNWFLLPLVTLAVLSMSSSAFAIDAAFTNLTTAICQVIGYLSGPIGFGLLVIMFLIGAISLMVGGRKAVPIMIAAAIGGVIIVSAEPIAQIFMPAGAPC